MNRRLRVNRDFTEEVEVGAEHYARAKWDEREAESRRKELGNTLLPMMLDAKVTKQKADIGHHVATVRVKTRTQMSIDEDRLKKALGASQFNKLTSPVLDEAKVEAAIQLGDVDPNVVASCTTEHETDYLEVRFKEKK